LRPGLCGWIPKTRRAIVESEKLSVVVDGRKSAAFAVGEKVRYRIGKGYSEGFIRSINEDAGTAEVSLKNGGSQVRKLTGLSGVA